MRKLLLAVAAAAILVAPAVAQAQSPIVIKFSHVVANDTPKGKGALKFKELAEKYTDGKVKVEVYPNSTLYKDKEEIEALQLGSVQMLAPSTAKFAPLGVKEFEALDLPWLFKDDADLFQGDEGHDRQVAVQEARDQGHHRARLLGQRLPHGLGQPAADEAGRFPGPEDSASPDRRSPTSISASSARSRRSWRSPKSTRRCRPAWSTAARTPPSNYLTQKFYEVQKDITVSYHAHLQYAVIVNSKFWTGLPPDIRTQLEKAMDEATDYTNSIAHQENEDALAEIKKSGKTTLHYLTDARRKAWQEAMQPTYKWAKGRVGQEVLDLVAKELDVKMN